MKKIPYPARLYRHVRTFLRLFQLWLRTRSAPYGRAVRTKPKSTKNSRSSACFYSFDLIIPYGEQPPFCRLSHTILTRTKSRFTHSNHFATHFLHAVQFSDFRERPHRFQVVSPAANSTFYRFLTFRGYPFPRERRHSPNTNTEHL